MSSRCTTGDLAAIGPIEPPEGLSWVSGIREKERAPPQTRSAIKLDPEASEQYQAFRRWHERVSRDCSELRAELLSPEREDRWRLAVHRAQVLCDTYESWQRQGRIAWMPKHWRLDGADGPPRYGSCVWLLRRVLEAVA